MTQRKGVVQASRQPVIEAFRLSRDPERLRRASAREVIEAAAEIARAWIRASDAPASLKASRAECMVMLDDAGLALGAEIRRRQT